MVEYKIRLGTKNDISFLWEMLYQAIYVQEGQERPSREVLNHPVIKKYLDDWGRKGDKAFIAYDSETTPVGAIWIRVFDESSPTYGYIDSETPVLSMAILPNYRGQGIGTLLLSTLLNSTKATGVKSLSLSVDPSNPALRLYKKMGFVKVGVNGTSWDMKATLT
ncbi:GNAT family N-acetyltransferase [Aquibacillus halophilus]|uniref:GNAT family N-acetyltransferase n=1 Tax=Aquibacillus halophilus TaxID=930132 RepID=UPI001F0D33BD|nr:GNAT family N-acetyltransferase [Aquibacillus halophilus]